jgi:beta-N-acetylhexosaminidase
MTETDKTLDELRDVEYKPFESAINEGAGVIMIGNIGVSDAEGNVLPAYISESIISDDLRGQLGFNGVIITDDLAVIAKDAEYSQQEAALRAINAGADMVYVSSDFETTYQYLLDSINDGAITEERLNDALVHIYTMKKNAM